MTSYSGKEHLPVMAHRTKYGYDFIDIGGKVSFDHTWMVEDYIMANVSPQSQGVILNLAEVPFVVSSFLAILLKVKEQLNRRRVELILMNPHHDLMDILTKVNANRYFTIIPSEEAIKKKLDQQELDRLLEDDES